jgi:hypothetical protein
MRKQATCHTCVYAHWDPGLWMRNPVVGVPGPADVWQPARFTWANERVPASWGLPELPLVCGNPPRQRPRQVQVVHGGSGGGTHI